MKQYFYYLITFCIICNSILAQSNKPSSSYKQRLTLARTLDNIPINQIKRIQDVILDLEKTNYLDTLGNAHCYIAYRYSEKFPKNIKLAIEYAKTSLSYFEEANYTGYRKHYSLDYLIKNLVLQGQYHEAISTFNEYSGSYTIQDDKISSETTIIKYVSNAYRQIGEVDAGINIVNNHLNKYNENDRIKLFELADLLLERSFLEYNKYDFISSYSSITKALQYEYLHNKHQDLSRISRFINQKALVFSKIGKKNEAAGLFDLYLDKELSIADRFTLLNNAYDNFASNNNYKVAHVFAKKAYSSSKNLLNNQDYRLIALNNLSESFRNISKVDSAIFIGNLAEELLQEEQLNTRENDQQSIKIWYQQLLNYEYKFNQRLNKTDLENAALYIHKIDSLVPEMLAKIMFEGSILQKKQELAEWYDAGIRVASLQQSPELFVKYSDQTKSLSLQKMPELAAEELKLIDSLQTGLKYLVREEAEINMKMSLQNNKSLSDSLSNIKLENREKQRILLTSLKPKYSANHSPFNYEFSQLSDKKTSILYFHKTDSLIYACHLHSDFQEIRQIGSTTEILELIHNYINNLKNKTYQKTEAKLLYSLLLPFDKLTEKIIIIPDQELSLLPFESLVDNNDSYLIKNHEVSYGLSYKHLIELSKSDEHTITEFKIVSPDYNQNYLANITATKGINTLDQKFSFLKHTKNEVHYMENTFNASLTKGYDITKERFFQEFTEADIFHFTGHAVSLLGHDDLSFLALGSFGNIAEQDIFIREIPEYKSNASLVFLNACNTGVGSVKKGEGVYNLARSFFKAGAKSVVSGLWEIEDHSSSEITKSFYAYLKDGKRKSKALQLAKLDYINNVELDVKKEPYYWSGLILTGNTSPLYQNWKSKYYLLGFLMLFFLSILFLRKRKITAS